MTYLVRPLQNLAVAFFFSGNNGGVNRLNLLCALAIKLHNNSTIDLTAYNSFRVLNCLERELSDRPETHVNVLKIEHITNPYQIKPSSHI